MMAMIKRFKKTFSISIYRLFVGAIICTAPIFCSAEIVINEIMYDFGSAAKDESDSGREWIEIKNTNDVPYDFNEALCPESGSMKSSARRFATASNDYPICVFSGQTTIPPGGFALITNGPSNFSGYTGLILKSNFSLPNSSSTLTVLNDGVNLTDSVFYDKNMRGYHDGNSLQLSGTSWIAALPTPGAANTTAVSEPPSDPSSSEPPSNNDYNTQSINTQNTSGSGGSHPVEPQIFAFIKSEVSSIIGADTIFSGSTLGLDKKPIENARYLWSFGDGAMKEGQTVAHSYFAPGTYLVILEVSVGDFNASARTKIGAAKSGFSIEKVETGGEGFIEIKNSLPREANISRWILRTNGKTFTFPSPTVILAGNSVAFPNAVTGLEPDLSDTELFYPNGALAIKFEQKIVTTKIAAVKPVAHTIIPKIETVEPVPDKEIPILAVKESSTTVEKPMISEDFSSSTIIYAAAAGASGNYTDWVLALGGLIGVGALVMIFSRRGSGVKAEETIEADLSENSDSKQALTADDFEIEEEKEE